MHIWTGLCTLGLLHLSVSIHYFIFSFPQYKTRQCQNASGQSSYEKSNSLWWTAALHSARCVSACVSSWTTEMAKSIKQWMPDLALHSLSTLPPLVFSARLTRAQRSVPGNIRAYCPHSEKLLQPSSTACAHFVHLGLFKKFLIWTLKLYLFLVEKP